MVQVEIRRLRLTDYRIVKRIEAVILNEYRRYLRHTGEKDTVSSFIQPAYFDHYARTKSSFAAVSEGKVVGYILSQPILFAEGEEKIVWLEYIAVLPRYRKKGVGSMLLSEVESWARDHGFSKLYTSLNPNNKPSLRLLIRNGFEARSWREATKKLLPA